MTGNAVLITGGGSGIGKAAADLFAERGWRVMIGGRRAAPLVEAAAHNGADYFVGDISEPGQAKALVESTVEVFGRLDAVVNNAGLFAVTTLEHADPDDVAKLFRTNVLAPTQLVRAALPYLKAAGGSVVNVTSAVAQRPHGKGAAFYGASKAALDYLTKSWAAELAGDKIRVNAIAPGPTDTPIQNNAGSPEDVALSKKIQAERLPLKRMGEPGEVARWIYLLAEPASNWVTGQIVAVDGGMTVA